MLCSNSDHMWACQHTN